MLVLFNLTNGENSLWWWSKVTSVYDDDVQVTLTPCWPPCPPTSASPPTPPPPWPWSPSRPGTWTSPHGPRRPTSGDTLCYFYSEWLGYVLARIFINSCVGLKVQKKLTNHDLKVVKVVKVHHVVDQWVYRKPPSCSHISWLVVSSVTHLCCVATTSTGNFEGNINYAK